MLNILAESFGFGFSTRSVWRTTYCVGLFRLRPKWWIITSPIVWQYLRFSGTCLGCLCICCKSFFIACWAFVDIQLNHLGRLPHAGDDKHRWRVGCCVGVIPHLHIVTTNEAFVWRTFIALICTEINNWRVMNFASLLSSSALPRVSCSVRLWW